MRKGLLQGYGGEMTEYLTTATLCLTPPEAALLKAFVQDEVTSLNIYIKHWESGRDGDVRVTRAKAKLVGVQRLLAKLEAITE